MPRTRKSQNPKNPAPSVDMNAPTEIAPSDMPEPGDEVVYHLLENGPRVTPLRATVVRPGRGEKLEPDEIVVRYDWKGQPRTTRAKPSTPGRNLGGTWAPCKVPEVPADPENQTNAGDGAGGGEGGAAGASDPGAANQPGGGEGGGGGPTQDSPTAS